MKCHLILNFHEGDTWTVDTETQGHRDTPSVVGHRVVWQEVLSTHLHSPIHHYLLSFSYLLLLLLLHRHHLLSRRPVFSSPHSALSAIYSKLPTQPLPATILHQKPLLILLALTNSQFSSQAGIYKSTFNSGETLCLDNRRLIDTPLIVIVIVIGSPRKNRD